MAWRYLIIHALTKLNNKYLRVFQYSSEEESENLQETAAGLAVKQKKELAKVDHTTVEYKPFRKNFYVEVPEITKMTQEEIDAYKEVYKSNAFN
jgi:hypothetical protein